MYCLAKQRSHLDPQQGWWSHRHSVLGLDFMLSINETSGSLGNRLSDMFSVSGSFTVDDLPVGAIFFERDGTMTSIISPESDEKDIMSITLAMDFAAYAFSRTDWMSEYVISTEKSLWEKARLKAKKKLRSNLRVIDGGLSKNKLKEEE